MRSTQPDVRNPLVRLPAAAKLKRLPAPAREALREVLRELSADARGRAEKSWRTNKAPMAAYWKAVAVYARHAAVLLRDESRPARRIQAWPMRSSELEASR